MSEKNITCLSAKGLHKQYGSRMVVNDVDISVSRNEVVGLLGPNGTVIPKRIISKPPSAELRDDQKDTDSLPEYDILDAILKKLVEDNFSLNQIINQGFNIDDVKKISMLLSRSEYKRFQSAPGPKVTEKAFGRDRRYPLTSGFRNWS